MVAAPAMPSDARLDNKDAARATKNLLLRVQLLLGLAPAPLQRSPRETMPCRSR